MQPNVGAAAIAFHEAATSISLAERRNSAYSAACDYPREMVLDTLRNRFHVTQALLKVSVDVENQLDRAARLVALDGEVAGNP